MPERSTLPGSSVDSLLADWSWAVRLARSLVHEQGAAEDLAQDGWVALLRARPNPDRSLRPWFRRVLRNRVHNAARDQERRERRESLVAESSLSEEEASSPEALLDRVRQQRLLADMVMGLQEPLRQTVLLRYYENLTSVEIGKRLSVAEGTVRWRLKEALDQLRARLGEWGDQSGKDWRRVLAPLVASDVAAPAAQAAVALATVKPAAAYAAVKVGAASLAALTFLAGASWIVGRPTQDEDKPLPAASEGAHPSRSVAPGTGGPLERQARRPPVPRFTATGAASTSGLRAGSSRVVPGSASVTGNLEVSVADQVIQSHVNEVRFCYEKELSTHPQLQGTVEVTFTVSADGRVLSSALQRSTVSNATLERCLLIAVRRWQFPALEGGGTAIVTYPVLLKPPA